MEKEKEKGRVLVDYELRELINKGVVKGNNLEKQVQPSSFEPKIGGEVFIKKGIVKSDKEVYRTIVESEYLKQDTSNGFELQVGKTYYFKLEEKLNLKNSGISIIKATPKSSIGRIFLYTRLMSDFSSSFNEIIVDKITKNREIDLWLVVQPLAWNTIIYPGMSLNQIKFFKGIDYILSDSEIWALHKKYGIIKNKRRIETNNGLKISLELYGKNSNGVVGLRAKESLQPVDMRDNSNKIENFFEPITENRGKIIINPLDKALLYSEKLFIPPETNAQLSDYYDIGLNALLHLAGFFDPNFGAQTGANGVLEVISYENKKIELTNKMDIALLQFFRNNLPEKVYGDKSLNSHYQGQLGPKTSKFFESIEYPDLKREFKKFSRKIITVPRIYVQDILEKINKKEFIFLEDAERAKLEKLIGEKQIQIKRYDCENNPDLLQPVPYVVIFNEKGGVLVYQRAESKKEYGDKRLFGKISIGVGGHFTKKDKSLEGCILREVMKEELDIIGAKKPEFVGALYTERVEVDTVHLGLIYTMLVKDARKKEEALKKVNFISFDELKGYPNQESWTEILGPYLDEIYKRTKNKI